MTVQGALLSAALAKGGSAGHVLDDKRDKMTGTPRPILWALLAAATTASPQMPQHHSLACTACCACKKYADAGANAPCRFGYCGDGSHLFCWDTGTTWGKPCSSGAGGGASDCTGKCAFRAADAASSLTDEAPKEEDSLGALSDDIQNLFAKWPLCGAHVPAATQTAQCILDKDVAIVDMGFALVQCAGKPWQGKDPAVPCYLAEGEDLMVDLKLCCPAGGLKRCWAQLQPVYAMLEGEGGIARLFRACATSGCCGTQAGGTKSALAAKSAQCGALTAKRVEMQRELRRLGVKLFGPDKPCRVLNDDDDTAQRKKARAAGRTPAPTPTTTSTKAPLHWWDGK